MMYNSKLKIFIPFRCIKALLLHILIHRQWDSISHTCAFPAMTSWYICFKTSLILMLQSFFLALFPDVSFSILLEIKCSLLTLYFFFFFQAHTHIQVCALITTGCGSNQAHKLLSGFPPYLLSVLAKTFPTCRHHY